MWTGNQGLNDGQDYSGLSLWGHEALSLVANKGENENLQHALNCIKKNVIVKKAVLFYLISPKWQKAACV